LNHEIFVSYSRRDNRDGWVTGLVDALQREHAEATAGTQLRIFFDRSDIQTMDDWEQRICEGLRSSRILLACLSPNYFESKWCRREWQLYLEHERDHGLPGEGVAPIYFVEVPGYESAACDQKIADWVRNISQRQYLDLRPFFPEGPRALHREEIRTRLAALDQQLAQRLDKVARIGSSPTTIPLHNPEFVGRAEELRLLRLALFGGRVGVVACVQGLGGIGKSALAFEYAHVMASDYPGGRWLLPCEGYSDLRQALQPLGRMLGFEFTEEEKGDIEKGFVRLCTDIHGRQRMLLLLDNVDESKLLSPALIARLPADKAHILITTRLAPNELPLQNKSCLALDELPPPDALRLLEKHRPFADPSERNAAEQIVDILGGFVLAVEAIGVFLRVERSVDYRGALERLKSEGFAAVEAIGKDDAIALSRHQENLLSATLAPSLKLLTPAERCALELAALLLPDGVPLPWLTELISTEFPEAVSAPKAGYPDPWFAVVRKLDGLRFLVPASDPNLRRMHRMIQQYVRTLDARTDERVKAIDPMVASRAKRLESAWVKHDTRWEIEPLTAWACRAIRRESAWDFGGDTVRLRMLLEDAGRCWDAQPAYCNVNIAQLCTSLGQVEEALCHINEARALFNLAIKLWDRCVDQSDPRLALAYADLASLEHRCGNGWYGWGDEERRRALELLAEITDDDAHVLLTSATKLVLTWTRRRGAAVEGEKVLRRAKAIVVGTLQRQKNHFDDPRPLIAFLIHTAVASLQLGGDSGAAGGLIAQAKGLIQQISDDLSYPWVALLARSRAAVEKADGNLTKAHDLLCLAIQLQESVFDSQHYELAESYAALAEVEEALGRTAEARGRWLDAANMGMKIWFPWGQLEKWTSWNMKAAKCEQASGNLENARALLQTVLTAFGGLRTLGSARPEKNPTFMNGYLFLADIEVQDAKLTEAKSYLEKARQISLKQHGEDHAETQKITQRLRELEQLH
jgi:tetratricopeptide (TPR) repeat protein